MHGAVEGEQPGRQPRGRAAVQWGGRERWRQRALQPAAEELPGALRWGDSPGVPWQVRRQAGEVAACLACAVPRGPGASPGCDRNSVSVVEYLPYGTGISQ